MIPNVMDRSNFPAQALRHFYRSQKVCLFSIIVLALAIRVAYVLVAPQLDPFLRRDPLYGDAAGYNALAINLANGLGLTFDGATPTSYRMPGYPAFLALIYVLVGPSIQVVRLIQAVVGALLCIPVFVIARRLGGPSLGVLAAVGTSLHPVLVYMTGWLYSETLFLLLLWTGVWLLVVSFDKSSVTTGLSAGAVFGLSTYLRPEIAFLPLFLLCAAILVHASKQQLATLLTIQIVIIAFLLPWVMRNTQSNGTLVLLTTNTGVNLYGGNNSRADGGSRLDIPFKLAALSELESDRELTRLGLDWIKANPQSFVGLVPAKLARFFSIAETENSGSALGQWSSLLNVPYLVFLLIALWGALRTRGEATTFVLVSIIAWYALTAVVFYGGTRVALPVAPALVTLAACAVSKFASDRVRRHQAVVQA